MQDERFSVILMAVWIRFIDQQPEYLFCAGTVHLTECNNSEAVEPDIATLSPPIPGTADIIIVFRLRIVF